MKKNFEELIEILYKSIKDSKEDIPFLNYYERTAETQKERVVC